MRTGVFYANIEIDPRDSKEADEKVSLGNLPNSNSMTRRKTMVSDAKTHVVPMSSAVDKYINKMVVIAKQVHEEVEERKKQQAAALQTLVF